MYGTPLLVALFLGCYSAVPTLIHYGADIGERMGELQWQPLTIALALGDLRFAKVRPKTPRQRVAGVCDGRARLCRLFHKPSSSHPFKTNEPTTIAKNSE